MVINQGGCEAFYDVARSLLSGTPNQGLVPPDVKQPSITDETLLPTELGRTPGFSKQQSMLRDNVFIQVAPEELSCQLPPFPDLPNPYPIIVEAQSSTVLRRNLGATGVPQTQAHHLIPTALENHPLVIRAKRSGWNNDAAINGVLLPNNDVDSVRKNMPFHNGPHKNYSQNVSIILDNLQAIAQAGQWTDEEARLQLNLLVADLRQQIQNAGGGVRIE